jgi:transposase-like protein
LEEDGVRAEQRPRRGEFERRYQPELKERAVRLVFETAAEQGDWHGAVGKVANQLGEEPTRSSRARRLSSGRSSTDARRDDPLNRRAPPLVRGRADLPDAGDVEPRAHIASFMVG